jgi:hypothetical protein
LYSGRNRLCGNNDGFIRSPITFREGMIRMKTNFPWQGRS